MLYFTISFYEAYGSFGFIAFPGNGGRQCFSFGKCIQRIQRLVVFGSRKPYISVVIVRSDSGCIDCLSITFQPFSYLSETDGSLFFYGTLWSGAYSQQKCSPFAVISIRLLIMVCGDLYILFFLHPHPLANCRLLSQG